VEAMIKDELQYKISKEWVEKFQRSIAEMDRDKIRKQNDPLGWQMLRDASQSHLNQLQEEITEYETLQNHDSRTPIVLKLKDMSYLTEILIKARMAAKLSQKELADLAWMPEEKIQEYEKTDYEKASFHEVMTVFDVLDIKIQQAEFLLPLDTLRRIPFTPKDLLSHRAKNSQTSSV
jgi:hypothetical protein